MSVAAGQMAASAKEARLLAQDADDLALRSPECGGAFHLDADECRMVSKALRLYATVCEPSDAQLDEICKLRCVNEAPSFDGDSYFDTLSDDERDDWRNDAQMYASALRAVVERSE
jgi:hypothetical protein